MSALRLSALLSIVLLGAGLLAAVPASAQQSLRYEVPFQGVLADAGTPITDPTAVLFRLYDAPAGGAVVWAETRTVTPDILGRFSTRLGTAVTFPSIAEPLWLAAFVGGAQIGPRTQVGAAAYAAVLYGLAVLPPADSDDAPAILGGFYQNEVGRAAVVSGGGSGGGQLSNRATGDFATIRGGRANEAVESYATIGGGDNNTATDRWTTVLGGRNNNATDFFASIGGGAGLSATGNFATVPGGLSNRADGEYSFAAGWRARAVHDGAFVWRDEAPPQTDFVSTAPRQFLVRAIGGVGIGTNGPAFAQLRVLNDATSDASATVHAENLGTGDALAGAFTSAGSTAALVAEATGSGAILRGLASGDLRFEVRNDGDVTADGAFTGGGADLAEFFPLDGGATVAPGQVVGLRGGRVSLATDGAEQIAVVSSNPAFVGNPDAAEGGALVALVGQVEVAVDGPASPGDVLVASGAGYGRARAVAVSAYAVSDGPVLGRVLTADGGRVVALVGVGEVAALRAVASIRAEQLARRSARIDALVERLSRLEAHLTPAP